LCATAADIEHQTVRSQAGHPHHAIKEKKPARRHHSSVIVDAVAPNAVEEITWLGR
jgi:hypothetical protein